VVFVESSSGRGSGTRITDTEILTAFEVVGEDDIAVIVRMDDGEELTAVVTGYNKQRDVALLTLPSPASGSIFDLIRAANFSRVIGQEVVVIGYAPSIDMGTAISAFGHVGVIWNMPGDVIQLQIDADTTEEMTGGPVVTRDGRLAGIQVDTSSEPVEHVFALEIKEILEIIGDLRGGSKE
jgi:S1-C subfamily serine protease